MGMRWSRKQVQYSYFGFFYLLRDFGGGEQSALPNAGMPNCARFQPGNPVIWNQCRLPLRTSLFRVGG
jgi:hypothetical protein